MCDLRPGLAQTLRTLTRDGFVHARSRRPCPPQVAYSLTGLGEGIAEHVTALAEWIADRIPEIEAARG